DRAVARAVAHDLRMHRAGVFDARHRSRSEWMLGLVLLQVFRGVGAEGFQAAGGAEMPGLALMLHAMACGSRIDRHAADWIPDGTGSLQRLGCVCVMRVRHGHLPWRLYIP